MWACVQIMIIFKVLAAMLLLRISDPDSFP